jgi:hypothetical protein
MKAWILGAAAAAAAAVAAPAAAQQYVMDFTISGYGSGTANFSTSGDASAGFAAIDSLSGTFNGDAISLLSPGSFPGWTSPLNDNLFTDAAPYFDLGGLSFSAGGFSYNIYSTGSLDLTCTDNGGHICGVGTQVSVRAAQGAVPEPATWAMMLLGFGGVGFAMRRARPKAALAQLA